MNKAITCPISGNAHMSAAPSTLGTINQAVRNVLPAIRNRARRTQQNRRVPEENVALLRDAGFPAQAQRDVWGANLDALVCGSYAPSGTLALAEGGWRVSGRWSFASGCDVAQWAVCGALLRPEGEPPQAVFLLIRASDYQIDDTWPQPAWQAPAAKRSPSQMSSSPPTACWLSRISAPAPCMGKWHSG